MLTWFLFFVYTAFSVIAFISSLGIESHKKCKDCGQPVVGSTYLNGIPIKVIHFCRRAA